MSEMLLMLCITVGLFAIGDILGVATKAKVSSIFVALMLFLILFMTGTIPGDIISKAGLSHVGRWASPILVFGMGTMINIKQLIEEWKTVLLTLISMVAALIGVFLVSPIIGKEAAIVSVPIMNGGIIATNIMVSGAMEKGFPIAAAFGTLVYAVQKFVGTPPASFYGLKEAKGILEEYRKGKIENADSEQKKDKVTKKISFAEKYKVYFTPFVCFTIAALAGYLSIILQELTGVNNSIWALSLGAVLSYLKLVPEKILDHGKSSGFITMVVFAAIIPSLAKIDINQVMTLSWQLIVAFIGVFVATYIVMFILPTWKLVGSKNLAMGISMSQLLGFPATYLIVNEIATAVAENEEEHEVIMKKIAPSYVIGGLASVTTLSILIAGYFVNFL
ncbi:MAG: hypothetical protein ACRCZO_18485 [Cetobacterium sp.]